MIPKDQLCITTHESKCKSEIYYGDHGKWMNELNRFVTFNRQRISIKQRKTSMIYLKMIFKPSSVLSPLCMLTDFEISLITN